MREQALKTLISAIDFGKDLDNFDELVRAVYILEDVLIERDSLESVEKMLKDRQGDEFAALSRILELSDKQIDDDAKVYSEEYGEMYELDDSFWKYNDDIITVQNAVYDGVRSRVMTKLDRERVEKEFKKSSERTTQIKERKPSIQEIEDFFLER